jgi:hypothetical protein
LYTGYKKPNLLLAQLENNFQPTQAGWLLAMSVQFFSVMMSEDEMLNAYFTHVDCLAAELNGNIDYMVGPGNILGVMLQGLQAEYHMI